MIIGAGTPYAVRLDSERIPHGFRSICDRTRARVIRIQYQYQIHDVRTVDRVQVLETVVQAAPKTRAADPPVEK